MEIVQRTMSKTFQEFFDSEKSSGILLILCTAAGAGILGGIGFTMSIFITNLAFAGNTETINSSKMAILVASLIAGTAGFLWLRLLGKSEATNSNMGTMNLKQSREK